jgi:hypothetical protein
VIQGVFPARDADTPFVARLQAGEAPFRTRRDKIISIENREVEKLLRDFHAHGMQSDVFWSGTAKAVAIKAGDRIAAAAFKFGSQNVSWHDAILTSKAKFARCWVLKTDVLKRSVFLEDEKASDHLLAHPGQAGTQLFSGLN